MCRMKVMARACHFYNNVEGESDCAVKPQFLEGAFARWVEKFEGVGRVCLCVCVFCFALK